MKFTSSTPYVTLPNFLNSARNSLTSDSFTFFVCVKLNTVPTSTKHIFSILSSDVSVNQSYIFSIIFCKIEVINKVCCGGT